MTRPPSTQPSSEVNATSASPSSGSPCTTPTPKPSSPASPRPSAPPTPQQHQGTVALAHVARLHHTVDPECLALLRTQPRGNEADDDLWDFVPRRNLPWWLWRHQLPGHATWYLLERWRH